MRPGRPGEQDFTRCDDSLATAGAITGVVRGPGGKPLAGVCAEAVPLARGGLAAFGTGIPVGVSAVVGGSYRSATCSRARTRSGSPSDAARPDTRRAGTGTRLQPTEAAASAVTVTVGATTSGIDATVTGPGHTPVAGECVTAVPAGKDFAGTLPPEFAISSKAGGYALIGVQPGTYKVKFSTGCGDSGFATQWWQDAGAAAGATVITVGAGAVTTGIDAALTR